MVTATEANPLEDLDQQYGNLIPESVQYLRQRMLEIPQAKDEKRAVLADIDARKQKIADGELTDKALDKPNRELQRLQRILNELMNSIPMEIVNAIGREGGELSRELQRLRGQKRSTELAFRTLWESYEPIREDVKNAEKALREAQEAIKLHGDDPNRKQRVQQRQTELKDVRERLEIAEESTEVTKSTADHAKTEYDCFIDWLVYGELRKQEA